MGLIPGLGGSPREGNGNLLQCSCLRNPMDRRAWWATVHGVTKSWTQLSPGSHRLSEKFYKELELQVLIDSRWYHQNPNKGKMNSLLNCRSRVKKSPVKLSIS